MRKRVNPLMAVLGIFGLLSLPRFLGGGSIDLSTTAGQKATAFLPIEATVSHIVTLKLEDSLSAGGNLVGPGGINFGSVNTLGSSPEPGISGAQRGNVGHYEAQFSFDISRSGQGGLTLTCRRSAPGNFNARDGVEIEDSFGTLRPLSALSLQPVTVLDRVDPGKYDKKIGINIYPQDKGVLKTVLQFTLSAF